MDTITIADRAHTRAVTTSRPGVLYANFDGYLIPAQAIGQPLRRHYLRKTVNELLLHQQDLLRQF